MLLPRFVMTWPNRKRQISAIGLHSASRTPMGSLSVSFRPETSTTSTPSFSTRIGILM
ncbi:hypothetical protein FOQG_19342 [Fusarium oxysporum f. sp. raphani 54005]|uniref:Uncharacterized protein n=1 Tax=Fusarium oxysporum f. sp. raphani 54005 TaxID=1089458 RepID=X0BBL1_FUSOX|nr:hypothetical protein FOQG_19342 [Fusarium oxysporum f. sp. raphani 54005]